MDLSQLENMFVLVPEEKCDAFIAKYVTPAEGTERDTSRDYKLNFLAKSREVFTRGRLFGLNNAADVEALKTLIGTLPEGYDTVIDYINSKVASAVSVDTTQFTIDTTSKYNLYMDDNGQISIVKYTPLSITSASLTPNTTPVEIGTAVTFTKISWATAGSAQASWYVKWPDGTTTTAAEGTDKEISGSYTVTKDSQTSVSATVYAKDSTQTSYVYRNTNSVSWQNKYFVGHASKDLTLADITSDVIRAWNDQTGWSTSKGVSFTAKNADGERWYYAYPSRLGNITKDVEGGFGAEMDNLGTVNVTNSAGFTESYVVFRGQGNGSSGTAVVLS